ncbi:bidirectional sugar transporter SWEET14-like [Telopea speciosissima]|uniref:bidirectional sugar transporter SWEET14-like n=1 Tax=Telopea speciosissima TaxID=54955 RepID=UPI001CC5DA58|nr:bidirectional sugar transporter SWEET14-like [Telopea speciosissima]
MYKSINKKKEVVDQSLKAYQTASCAMHPTQRTRANDPCPLIPNSFGNFISLLVYIAPIPTFRRIYKNKSTEGFQSVPYLAALFSAMLWIYYAFLKTGAYYIITINSFGCVIETIYIVIYLIYAPKKARNSTAMMLALLNLGGFCLILVLTQFLATQQNRIKIVGMICIAFSVCVFVAPLSIMVRVIRTKSVEYMPFTLSFFLTLSAVMWFFYGLLLKDRYIAIPNILGFSFGVAQMLLYLIYRKSNKEKNVKEEEEQINETVMLSMISCSEPV